MLIKFSVFQTSESCIKLHAVVLLELFLSEQCPLLQVCVCPLLQVCVHCSKCVCTWMGQMQRTHFTAGYTLHNCVCEKKKRKYRLSFFFQNRYPIMVKCLNIGKNIGKPIYRSISNCHHLEHKKFKLDGGGVIGAVFWI